MRSVPTISFRRHTLSSTATKNTVSFEPDERKRRGDSEPTFTENWNYNAKGNAYYQYQYLDERVVNLIMQEVNYYMTRYNIMMEDINMVILDLAIAIMYYRVTSGREPDRAARGTIPGFYRRPRCEDLLDSLEDARPAIFLPLSARISICMYPAAGCWMQVN